MRVPELSPRIVRRQWLRERDDQRHVAPYLSRCHSCALPVPLSLGNIVRRGKKDRDIDGESVQ